MVPPHVPGAERLPVMTAACLARRSAIQAGQLPAAPEIKAGGELDVVAEVQHGGGGQVRVPRAGEGRVELPAAGPGAVTAGVGRRAPPVFHAKHAAARGGWVSRRGALRLPVAALPRVPPRALPRTPCVAVELTTPVRR